jgi:polyphosphate:AMP phosphotransferase
VPAFARASVPEGAFFARRSNFFVPMDDIGAAVPRSRRAGHWVADMFETAQQEHDIDKATYEREEARLRSDLLQAQLELVGKRSFPVIILITGSDGAGKGRVIQRLYEWLDPRHIRSSAYDAPSKEERRWPRMWRYWYGLPPKGEVGVVFGSWYNQPIIRRVSKDLEAADFELELARINRFEEMLAQEGALILKFLLLLSEKEQKKRAREIRHGPRASRHVLEEWGDMRHRKQAVPVAELAVRRTSTGHAPWIVVPSDDPQYRDLTFGRTIANALRKRLDNGAVKPMDVAPDLVASLDHKTVLDGLDMSLSLDAEAYKKELARWQDRLAELTDRPAFHKIALIGVFEGNDAAGKGGAIRRVTAALDPRRLRIHPIAAPSDEEKAQPYLWRFWRRVPRLGHTAIFDRSWYGRVLVERVEGYAGEPEWLRAYGEINEFEEALARDGIVLAKFWLATSKEEQLRRFQEREKIPFKQFKITPDDWRNREKWDAYAQAVSDMVDRTSTPHAPWTLVEAESKHWARVKVLRTICERLERAL